MFTGPWPMCTECVNVGSISVVLCLFIPKLLVPSLMEERVCLPFYTALCLLGLLICDNEDNRPLTFAAGLPGLNTHRSGCLVNLSAQVSSNLISQALLALWI